MPIYTFLFLCRIPFVASLSIFYFGIIEWLPVGGTIKYAVPWALLGVTGVWWVDFQVDGVKRGYVILSHGQTLHNSSQETKRLMESTQTDFSSKRASAEGRNNHRVLVHVSSRPSIPRWYFPTDLYALVPQ